MAFCMQVFLQGIRGSSSRNSGKTTVSGHTCLTLKITRNAYHANADYP